MKQVEGNFSLGTTSPFVRIFILIATFFGIFFNFYYFCFHGVAKNVAVALLKILNQTKFEII